MTLLSGPKGTIPIFVSSVFSNNSFDPAIHSSVVQLDWANRFSINITELSFGAGVTGFEVRFETNTVGDQSDPKWTGISVTNVPVLPPLGGEVVLPLAKVVLLIDTEIVPATPNYAGYEWQFRMTSPYFRAVPRIIGVGSATVSMEVRRMLG